jgi:flagellar basal-body rod protein FlgB
MIESPLLNFIENRLDVSAKRQQLISGNIANVDTPGYLAQDVTFDQQMAMLNLSGTSTRHLGLSVDSAGIRVTDSSSEVKPNGNSVDLDRELTESTKNGLEFVMLMQFLQNKLRTMRSSITEGA